MLTLQVESVKWGHQQHRSKKCLVRNPEGQTHDPVCSQQLKNVFCSQSSVRRINESSHLHLFSTCPCDGLVELQPPLGYPVCTLRCHSCRVLPFHLVRPRQACQVTAGETQHFPIFRAGSPAVMAVQNPAALGWQTQIKPSNWMEVGRSGSCFFFFFWVTTVFQKVIWLLCITENF